MADRMNYHLVDYSGIFTSFLDGGNYFRAWLTQLASFNIVGLAVLPLIIFLLIFTWKVTKEEASN
jgi:PTS system galactitol-specific IIC component